MAVLKKGTYKGEYKDGELSYHMFSPEEIGVNGEVQYVRIGDYEEVFPTNRKYTLMKVNEEEKKLIDGRK